MHHDRQPFVHPEWAATVWGKARAKLSEFALQLPYDDIVRFATDSVWSASRPEWINDKGKWDRPGEFVVKDHVPGPLAWWTDSGKMREFVISYNLKHNNTDALVSADSLYEDEEQ